MAHFAEVNADRIVVRVVVVPDEHEKDGLRFCSEVLGLGGRWIQTSYNRNFRGKFAAPGDTYDEALDEFLPHTPLLSPES